MCADSAGAVRGSADRHQLPQHATRRHLPRDARLTLAEPYGSAHQPAGRLGERRSQSQTAQQQQARAVRRGRRGHAARPLATESSHARHGSRLVPR